MGEEETNEFAQKFNELIKEYQYTMTNAEMVYSLEMMVFDMKYKILYERQGPHELS